MAVPPFGAGGMLPLGSAFGKDADGNELYYGHACTLGEVETSLVKAFPLSASRPICFRELSMLFDTARPRVSAFSLWISGEFVVNTDDPKTLFVVLDVPGEEFAALAPYDGWLLGRLFKDSSFYPTDQPELKIDTGICRFFSTRHIRHEVGLAERELNRYMAGRPHDDREGGYLEILHNEGGTDKVDAFLKESTERNEPSDPA